MLKQSLLYEKNNQLLLVLLSIILTLEMFSLFKIYSSFYRKYLASLHIFISNVTLCGSVAWSGMWYGVWGGGGGCVEERKGWREERENKQKPSILFFFLNIIT